MSESAQPSPAIPPDDPNRKLSVAGPTIRRCATSPSSAAPTRSCSAERIPPGAIA
jgi:hypothetical protein